MSIKPPDRKDADVLEEIRERFRYATNAWRKIREEGQKDIRYIAGEPWEEKDRKAREDAGRPCLTLDELGQYVNQGINDLRQNKRAIKVTPMGDGADDASAETQQSLIRQIEYRSNAQQEAYTALGEDAFQRSYGFCRIKAQLANKPRRDKAPTPESFHYELVLEALPNPDLVTVDPDDVTPTASKIQYAFIHESLSAKQFKRDYPDAEIKDFTDSELQALAPEWIKEGERVLVAEYWTIETVRAEMLLFGPQDQPRAAWAEDLPSRPPKAQILRSEWVDVPYVCQYLTNGVELLAKKGEPKKTAWPGTSIPIVACYGKSLFVNSGGITERRLLSLIRLARDPFMAYCYAQTCKLEAMGGVPRATWVGYAGQFRGHETEWQKANHEPVPYLEAKPFTEATGADVLPLPTRNSWDPPLQNIELAAEGYRRAIQAAMGVSPMPTDAQRINQKSGKALRQIESSAQKGSYHFVDHYDAAITRVGQLLLELIPYYYDTARAVTVRQPDDTSKVIRINDPKHLNPKTQKPYSTVDGYHDATISVGPAFANEREAASDFADSIVGNPQIAQVVGPQKAAELLALAIRLKSVGPIGDEMADVISPKDDGASPSPQQVRALQGQMQQMGEQLAAAQKAIETDQAKQQAQIAIKKMDLDFQREKLATDSEVKIAVAELGAKVDRLALFLEERARLSGESTAAHDRAHEAGLTAMAHGHALAAAQQAHDHALAQGAAGTENAMTQAEHAQAIAPPEAEAA